ncbi:hypothetical protein [Kocuria sabuli]|uniref:hypothetical protein n=1 Tax=Kocuria sabuli TaxID=3071448 RepID=UPI0034D4C85E
MMSKAVFPQSTAWSTDLARIPLLPLSPEAPVDAGSLAGDPRFHRAELVRRVFTAAGEVESAEWALDQALDDAAVSDDEIGVGLDIAPVDGTLETARWALDQATSALHAEIRAASRRGVPLAVLAEVSALEVQELRAVLDGTGAELAPVVLPAAV